MFGAGQIVRLLAIQRVLVRHGLDELVFAVRLFRRIRWLQYVLPWNWFNRVNRNRESRGVRIRSVLEELGPIYIKFGQLLSTRRDMLPEDIAVELEKLQDHVPPFSGKVAKKIVEAAFAKGIDDVFLQFDETPLASASIAQVHAATLKDGREIIVKVVRPEIEKVMRRDLGIMHLLAEMFENYSADVKQLKPTSVVREFEKTLMNELDLMREAASASQLRRNFMNSRVLYIPQVLWELTSRNVMAMERVSGIPVNDMAALKQAGVDLKWLAESGVEIFFTQVFRDSFFHADMHPGNIFVNPDHDGQLRIMMVDFGIMSSLNEFDQRYLAENFLAFLNRNYQKVAELHVESGWVPRGTRVDEFEFAIRTVCEPLFDRPLREISFGALLLRLFQIAQRFNMVILPQLILLQKTLVSIEGLGRQLYPDLDLWRSAKPIMERWMENRMGVRGLIKGTKDSVPYWVDRLPEIPQKTIDLIERLRDGKIQIELKSGGLDELRREFHNYNRNNVLVILGSALILSAIIFYTTGTPVLLIGKIPVVPLLLGLAGAWMILKVLNHLDK